VMTALGQETMLIFSKFCAQTIHHYMGLTENAFGSKKDIADSEEAYHFFLRSNQENAAVKFLIHRLVLSCHFNDFAGTGIYATRSLAAVARLPSVEQSCIALFYVSITYLENATNGFWKKRKALRIARRAAILLKKLALHCPYNFSPFRLLLDAEVAAAKGQEMVAHELYSCSISCSKSSLSLMTEAFGNERCGRFLYKAKRLDEAMTFFEEACRVYTMWGGMAKVIRLKEEMHSLFAATKTA
jgi:tetratricopeptide (TPR) repeat protein